MVHTTSEYYTQFTSSITAEAIRKWTKEITSAEAKRLKNSCVMDVMSAHHTEFTPDPVQSESCSTRGAGTDIRLTLALSIEERQYV